MKFSNGDEYVLKKKVDGKLCYHLHMYGCITPMVVSNVMALLKFGGGGGGREIIDSKLWNSKRLMHCIV